MGLALAGRSIRLLEKARKGEACTSWLLPAEAEVVPRVVPVLPVLPVLPALPAVQLPVLPALPALPALQLLAPCPQQVRRGLTHRLV